MQGGLYCPAFLKGEKMQVYKDGIEKTIRESQWQTYKERGYIQVAENIEEPKPIQDVEVADDFVVKPAKKKKVTKKEV